MLITSWLFLFVSIFDLLCFFFSINDCHHRKILYTHTHRYQISIISFLFWSIFFSWNIENLFVLFLDDFNLFTSGGHTMVEWLIIFFAIQKKNSNPISRNKKWFIVSNLNHWVFCLIDYEIRELLVWISLFFSGWWNFPFFLVFGHCVIDWIEFNPRKKNSFDCFAKQKNISWFAGRIVSFYFLTIQRKPVKILKW